MLREDAIDEGFLCDMLIGIGGRYSSKSYKVYFFRKFSNFLEDLERFKEGRGFKFKGGVGIQLGDTQRFVFRFKREDVEKCLTKHFERGIQKALSKIHIEGFMGYQHQKDIYRVSPDENLRAELVSHLFSDLKENQFRLENEDSQISYELTIVNPFLRLKDINELRTGLSLIHFNSQEYLNVKKEIELNGRRIIPARLYEELHDTTNLA